ncbi:kinase-like protein, partial [Aureobasidium melanogenum]
MKLLPQGNFNPFSGLAQAVQDELTSRFLKKWRFRSPQYRGNAPALQQGEWLPIQTSRDDRGQEQPLGDGGLGVVHLWCCVDANNRVIDRVIVKNVFPGTEAWALPSLWRDGRIGGEPREAMISNEVYDQLEAANPGDGRFVTRCLGYGNIHDPFRYDDDGMILSYLDPLLGDADILGGPPRVRNPLSGKPVTYRIPSYKLYFEYCAHGDLHTQIQAQTREENRNRVTKARKPGGNKRRKLQVIQNVPFHEGFIWRMFEALAKCAVAMERANVLHGDLCPTNIFLGASDPNRFKIWPVPKLSDFGSSRHIDFMTKNRFEQWEEAMQVSFTPPELARPRGRYEVPGMKITHKTNVWQIGMVIACMMRLDVYLPETDWRTMPSQVPPADELHFDDPYRRELKDRLFQHRNCHYSPELIGLVKDCMRFRQLLRPTPQRLLAKVQQLMQGRCGGMETYTGDANRRIPWNKKEKLRDLQQDQWQEVDPVFVV